MSRQHRETQACKYGEAPGYWRTIPPGRRQWVLYDDACELADLLSLHLQVKLVSLHHHQQPEHVHARMQCMGAGRLESKRAAMQRSATAWKTLAAAC